MNFRPHYGWLAKTPCQIYKNICRTLVLLVKWQTGKHQTPKDVFFCLFADDCMVGNENDLLDTERIDYEMYYVYKANSLKIFLKGWKNHKPTI